MILESVIIIGIILYFLIVFCVLFTDIILEILIEYRNYQDKPADYSKYLNQ